MKIAIEADSWTREARTGVYFYVHRLVSEMARIYPSNSYISLRFIKSASADFPPSVQEKIITWFPRRLYSVLLRVALAPPLDFISGVSADVFFFPAFSRWPLRRGRKSVVMIHDTFYKDHPEVLKNNFFRWYLNRAAPRSLKKASAVIVNSEYTKRRLISLYQTPAERITVITPGVDPAMFKPVPKQQIAHIMRKYGLKPNYLLYVGTLEPRKNIVGIINAYLKLPARLREKHQLVLAGNRGWGEEAIGQAIRRVPADQLVLPGYIADEDLAALYSGASAFLFPSLYEGWGMPVLEAMACATPVITANNSSLPEAAGDAAIMVAVEDTNGLASAIERVVTDPKVGAELKERGLKHVANFTWEGSARRLARLFEEVASD